MGYFIMLAFLFAKKLCEAVLRPLAHCACGHLLSLPLSYAIGSRTLVSFDHLVHWCRHLLTFDKL